jgi:diguanylate cyclase (GGDEF)-like protein
MHTATLIGTEEFRTMVDSWTRSSLTVAMLDIVEFADLNERYGREAGDRCIAAVQRTLEGSLPDSASVARMGGDEWAAALPDTTAEDAVILFEEVRQHLLGRPNPGHADADPVRIAVGIANLPEHVGDAARLVAAADEALHRAKRGGGRSAIYVEDRMTLKSNYYPKAQLARLAKLADRLGRTEASLLREALGDLLDRFREER